MKLSKLMCVLSLIVATSLPGAVIAKQTDSDTHPKQMQHDRQHQVMHKMLASLDLTPSQKAQIKALVEQHREKYQASKPKAGMRHKVQQLVSADSFDEVAARSLLEQQQQKDIERRLDGLKLQHEIRQLLTPEQRQQLSEKQQKLHNKRQQRDNG